MDPWRRPGSPAVDPPPAPVAPATSDESVFDRPPSGGDVPVAVDVEGEAVDPALLFAPPDRVAAAPVSYDGRGSAPAPMAPMAPAAPAAPVAPAPVRPTSIQAVPEVRTPLEPDPPHDPAPARPAPLGGAQFLRAPLALIAAALLVAFVSSCFFMVEALDLSDAGDVGSTPRLVGAILAGVGNLVLALAIAWVVLLLGRRSDS
jgi:hypothetical protein